MKQVFNILSFGKIQIGVKLKKGLIIVKKNHWTLPNNFGSPGSDTAAPI